MYSSETSIQILSQLAQKHSKQNVLECEPLSLAQSASHRKYYRIKLEDGTTLIGAFNDDVDENIAFFSYTRFFTEKKFNVPTLLAVAPDNMHYIETDLGSTTLYDFLLTHRENGVPSPEVVAYYDKVARALPAIQLSGKQGIEFSVAYPRAAFDRQSMQWDLNYFKYFFLKLVNVPFNEQLIENDFNCLMDYLLSADSEFFLYRDFQARNIMIYHDDVYFIDYQGGRKGALQYDVASLLYNSKADLSPEFRNHILNEYLNALSQHIKVDRATFLSYFQGFVLIRILQSLGTYGYRGYFERKSSFLQSIPFAIRNLKNLLGNLNIPIELPELTRVLRDIIASDFVKPYIPGRTLTVRVQSFSYKKAIPNDPSPNGGGFVFDCRALPNPGRDPKFKTFTGKDACVQEYLNQYPAVETFKEHVFAIVDQSIDNYLERHFDHLMVSFGCTGGQHRSVYFAEQTAAHIQSRYPEITVILNHTEQNR